MDEKNLVECVLCRKEKDSPKWSGGWAWSKVCPECRVFWELGKKKEKLAKSEGKAGHAKVIFEMKTDGKDGDPLGDTTIRSKDIIAAMGATGLRGTSISGRFSTPEGTVFVGRSNTSS